jgi:hypothetical protein
MSLTKEQRDKINKAFWTKSLKVRSATKDGVKWMLVKDIMRHETLHKPLVRVSLRDGRRVTCTHDHSLISPDLTPLQASTARVGDYILATMPDGFLGSCRIVSVESVNPHFFTYDLCVPGPENFILSNGIVAHNSYSIGGISLDLNKSSQYESLKGNAEQQLDKMLESKSRTVKIMRGLKQSRYGIGVRSAFGPALSGGNITPRKYLGF